MTMKKFLLLLLALLLFLPPLMAQQKVKEKDLPAQYQDWLNVVQYIIHPKEKEVFLRLATDRERDLFIESFWKQRDPTPGTPQNEYKEEHMRRFAYANKFYGRNTTRPGWQTDQGRIYIILGAPVSIERFDPTSGIIPCEGWSYYGDPAKDLPAHFVILFFQRGGIGEYKIYDPAADGPAALLVNKRDIDPTDYSDLYERIKQMAPTLADLSISMVPGEYYIDYQPSPQNNIILANIFESPRKDINPSYATHFLEYKGIVSTEYMSNFVDSEANVSVIDDPLTGISFVHFALAPKKITLDQYEPKNQRFGDFRVDVSLRVGEAIVFQYNKEFPVYINEGDVGRFQANGISIEDSFPVARGKYRLTILLQNSVGKEFSICERDIDVPAAQGQPRLQGPFLGYRLEPYGNQVHIPYKVLDKKLVVDPKETFGSAEDLALLVNVLGADESIRKGGEVRVEIKGLRAVNPARKSLVMPLDTAGPGKTVSLVHTLALGELAPDYYQINAVLADGGGRVLDESTANFILSPESAVPHPIAWAKGFPLSSLYLYRHMLARQYDKMNRDDLAEAEYRTVLAQAPGYKEGILDYVVFLLKVGKFDQAFQVNEGLKDTDKFRFDYFYLRGRAQMGRGFLAEAIDSFLSGNSIYNSDTRLLNSLGLCYYRTGQKKKALETLEASLKLNPKQDDIVKLVAEIEKS
jgi:GWxTD domain-containing protein